MIKGFRNEEIAIAIKDRHIEITGDATFNIVKLTCFENNMGKRIEYNTFSIESDLYEFRFDNIDGKCLEFMNELFDALEDFKNRTKGLGLKVWKIVHDSFKFIFKISSRYRYSDYYEYFDYDLAIKGESTNYEEFLYYYNRFLTRNTKASTRIYKIKSGSGSVSYRVGIPIEFIKKLNLEDEKNLMITLEDDKLILEKKIKEG